MNLSVRALQASLLALLVLLPLSSAVATRIDRRELASDDISAQCSAFAAQTTLTGVSFVVEPACNVTKVAMDGCVPLTTCQLCRKEKTELNAFLISCDVLNGWKLRTQQQQQHQEQVAVATTAVEADELEFQGEIDTDNTTASASTRSSATGSLSSPAEAVGAIAVAVVALVGGVFIVKHHRQRRMEEDALGTPKDAAGVLVSVQSRTQIATI